MLQVRYEKTEVDHQKSVVEELHQKLGAAKQAVDLAQVCSQSIEDAVVRTVRSITLAQTIRTHVVSQQHGAPTVDVRHHNSLI